MAAIEQYKWFKTSTMKEIATAIRRLKDSSESIVFKDFASQLQNVPSLQEYVNAVCANLTIDSDITIEKIGDTYQIIPTGIPSDDSYIKLVWTSSNAAIATVDQNGVVTGVSEGGCNITVRCGEISKTCFVTVVKSSTIANEKFNLRGLSATGLSDIGDIHKNRILFYNEDFEGNEVDPNYFSVWDNRSNDAAYCTKDNVTVSNSICRIEGKTEDRTVNGKTYHYTAGGMQNLLHFQNCLVESKIRMNRVKDFRQAYWTCGYNVVGLNNWANCGEIDFFEDSGSGNVITFHYSQNWAHKAGISRSTVSATVDKMFKNGADEEWHIYGCELLQGKVNFYFDDELFATYDTANNSYSDGVNPFDYWQHFIWSQYALNNNVNGNIYMDIDWIRAWSLEGETAEDLIPQSVSLKYLGNENRLDSENKTQVGTIVQLYPVYVPNTVPIACNTSEATTFAISGDGITNGGAIEFLEKGDAVLSYTDIVGTTTTMNFSSYEDEIPDGEIALEDFNSTTSPCRFGRRITSKGKLYIEGKPNYEKCIRFGIFSVKPSTEYTFSMQKRYSNQKMYVYMLDSEKKVITVNAVVLSNNTTFTTDSNAVYVALEASTVEGTVKNDLPILKNAICNVFKPSFSVASTESM